MVLQPCTALQCVVQYLLALAARLAVSSIDFAQVFQSDLPYDSVFALKRS